MSLNIEEGRRVVKGDILAEVERTEYLADVEQTRGILMRNKAELAELEKKVGDRIKIFGTNYRDLELECEIVGTFPLGRYDNNSCINRDYLNASLDAYKASKGKPHPLANKTMNLVWVKVQN